MPQGRTTFFAGRVLEGGTEEFPLSRRERHLTDCLRNPDSGTNPLAGYLSSHLHVASRRCCKLLVDSLKLGIFLGHFGEPPHGLRTPSILGGLIRDSAFDQTVELDGFPP